MLLELLTYEESNLKHIWDNGVLIQFNHFQYITVFCIFRVIVAVVGLIQQLGHWKRSYLKRPDISLHSLYKTSSTVLNVGL